MENLVNVLKEINYKQYQQNINKALNSLADYCSKHQSDVPKIPLAIQKFIEYKERQKSYR